MDRLLEFESKIINFTGWPLWSCRSIEVLVSIVAVLSLLQVYIDRIGGNDDCNDKGNTLLVHQGKRHQFRMFQVQYLVVYITVMLADWLQGTNMYTLYASYGVDIGTLFLTGFLSSAIFGTFLGVYVDMWGRKLGCILFCVLEIAINLLEHIPSMPILLAGRLLGGLSTSLLFSTFESWMVSEHRKRGFPEEWLSSTFSISSWSNGFSAIIAGIMAQFAVDASGDIGPFQVAIALTVLSLVLILPWRENYGSSHELSKDHSLVQSLVSSVSVILKTPSILYLGLGQAFFEGGMYTFVYLWVPSLISVAPGSLPTGLTFSSLMLAMAIGGMLYSLVLPICPGGAEWMSVFICLIAAVAMAVPILNFSFWWVYISFLVMEAMVGMFYSNAGILRSKYFPEAQQTSIMTVFRLPMNLIVVIGTNLSSRANDVVSKQFVFRYITIIQVAAMLCQLSLILAPKKAKQE